jgi:5-methyltetrahydrofolate--homocysteine methyltransferase
MNQKPKILDLAKEQIIVLDGAMGTTLQQADISMDDFAGLEGCNEILVETRPDAIKAVHAGFYAAGCDVAETNTFGANGVVLEEYGIPERTHELNRLAASLAREVANDFEVPGRPRYVLGSIGPGTRLPSLGHITFDELSAAFLPQVLGLMEGGADALCIETCQDLLQTKAVIDASRVAFAKVGRRIPIFVSVTIEATGTMLVGSDMQTAITALWSMGIDVLGLNCATGPSEMKRHVEHLDRFGPAHIMAMPNAGLPENVDGEIEYTLTPGEFADWVEGFVRENHVGIVGGCCGTTTAHLSALAKRVQGMAAPRRQIPSAPRAVASLFQAVSMVQEPPPLIVGERTNANGSKIFRQRLLADDIDGMLAVAREQEKGGAHLLDVSVAYVGRDEMADMEALLPPLVRTNRLPITIDSTDPVVIEAALKRAGGRCVINSINLEDGYERFDQIASLAKRFGAALIALVIDETEMAMTTARKLEVAERILERCTKLHGLAESDLIFDMLTFTVASGDASTRRSAVETLDAIEELKRRHPDVFTILGVSNVSFGLKPAARKVLNSVFLHMAVERGLDQAIVNARGILPLYRIDDARRTAAELLLLDDDSAGAPLPTYMALFESVEKGPKKARKVAKSPREEIHMAVVDGAAKGLSGQLDCLLADGTKPVAVINEVLIPAMQEVGKLFGSGQMQLPFVLQSAEVMKAAVSHLEPLMEKGEAAQRGTLVLATVKGDVHDIGKNLVEIIVSNNGFKVVNLGTKVQIEEMLKACDEHEADALGMSGLLVKSTVIMKDNLAEMKRRGYSLPVLLGGAALNRPFVDGALRDVYGPNVFYCLDAFEGLHTLQDLGESEANFTATPETDSDPLNRPRQESDKTISLETPRRSDRPTVYGADAGGGDELLGPDIDYSVEVPNAPFLGSKVVQNIPLDDVFELLNETTLFRGQWRYRRGTQTREEFQTLIDETVRPTLQSWKERCRAKSLLVPKAVYGYFKAVSEGRTVRLFDRADNPCASFTFPRKLSAPHHCIADYIRPAREGGNDIFGLFAVTVGDRVMEEIRRLHVDNHYKDYLHLHGLAVESAEATAEWLHRRMRLELGITEEDRTGEQAMVRQGYRGSRYSFGYPACPDLEDQRPLFQLLDPSRIGVTLTESEQMVPEVSVSAIVLHHPQAKYFNLD